MRVRLGAACAIGGRKGPVPHVKRAQTAATFLIPPAGEARSTGLGPPVCQVCHVSFGKSISPSLSLSFYGVLSGFHEACSSKVPGSGCPIIGNDERNCTLAPAPAPVSYLLLECAALEGGCPETTQPQTPVLSCYIGGDFPDSPHRCAPSELR